MRFKSERGVVEMQGRNLVAAKPNIISSHVKLNEDFHFPPMSARKKERRKILLFRFHNSTIMRKYKTRVTIEENGVARGRK
jgi:hypothetical protein